MKANKVILKRVMSYLKQPNITTKPVQVSDNKAVKLSEQIQEPEKEKKEEHQEQQKLSNKVFDAQIFDALPNLLKDACKTLTDNSEKEVFLVGALGVVSGILPNVEGVYKGKKVEANLYCYVLAQYGTGKGALNFASCIGEEIHNQRKSTADIKRKLYESAKNKYEDDKKNKIITDPPVEPQQTLLYIPANSSKSGIYELLGANDGRGIIFETEGDVLADALKQDFSNFSDGLRKAFHHEKISFYRRTGKELVEIEKPAMSVVLSSTFDQLINLIPTIENGLFSRFLFYVLKNNHEFSNVFDKNQNQYPTYFKTLGKDFLKIYNQLNNLKEPITFDLTDSQKDKFMAFFIEIKTEISEFVSTDLGGTINRLGLICFRIAMIFTTLRAFETENISKKIFCSDNDFENALRITKVLLKHAISIYYFMPKPKPPQQESSSEDKTAIKLSQIQQMKDLRKTGKSYNQIAIEVLKDEKYKSKVYRWVNY